MLTLLLLGLFQVEVQQMDSDVYRERESAHAVVKLMVMNSELCANKLREVQKNHPSLEVRTRARRIMECYYGSAIPYDIKKLPPIDMIKDRKERKAVLSKYFGQDDYTRRGYYPDFEPMRHATYYYINEKMKQGWTRTQARSFMEEMIQEERSYEYDNRYNNYCNQCCPWMNREDR